MNNKIDKVREILKFLVFYLDKMPNTIYNKYRN